MLKHYIDYFKKNTTLKGFNSKRMIRERKFNVKLNNWIFIIPIAVFTISGGSKWQKIGERSRANINIFKSSNGKYLLTESYKLFLPENLQIKYPGKLTVSDIGCLINCQVGSGIYSFHFH